MKERFEGVIGKRVLVVGLGKTGFSLSRFLKRLGAEVIATDIKPISDIAGGEELQCLGVTIEAGGHTVKSFLSSDLIVVSPGVESDMPLLEEAKRKGTEVINDIELFSRYVDVPVFAVTGTNGKSTTTTLLAEIFKRAGRKVFMGGNIGIPAMEYFEGTVRFELCVLEISSFHLELVKTFCPRVAVLLNITEDHLYRHKSFKDYADVKFRIFSNQGKDDYAVLNVGDPAIRERLGRQGLKSNVIPFTTSGRLKQGLYLRGREIVSTLGGKEDVYPAEGFYLAGVHNTENIMAVIAAASVAGIEKETLCDTVKNFRGLPHRMEFVREFSGVRYFNDSKSTNGGSLFKALEGIGKGKRVILIAGGKDKGGDYGFLREIAGEKVKLLIVIGEAKKRLKDALEGVAGAMEAEGLKEAVTLAGSMAQPGDVVLFSPACSSFDMFRNFEERGEAFKKLVEGLREC
ncbi:MAG: UDP-N-acetylmuramoyl-L-alanine--D-glutamate ligase [Deltaproteobacteria bacterium]|nr:UDP-N-acetylmuramoyl-L-alanine--D-glutamate ligase [Deltaproteobacteria bacterium]